VAKRPVLPPGGPGQYRGEMSCVFWRDRSPERPRPSASTRTTHFWPSSTSARSPAATTPGAAQANTRSTSPILRRRDVWPRWSPSARRIRCGQPRATELADATKHRHQRTGRPSAFQTVFPHPPARGLPRRNGRQNWPWPRACCCVGIRTGEGTGRILREGGWPASTRVSKKRGRRGPPPGYHRYPSGTTNCARTQAGENQTTVPRYFARISGCPSKDVAAHPHFRADHAKQLVRRQNWGRGGLFCIAAR